MRLILRRVLVLTALLEFVGEAVLWILSFIFPYCPEEPQWLKVLVAVLYIAILGMCVVAAVVLVV